MSWAEVKMAVKSIQRGYAEVTNADVTITLPKAVDPSRCLVLLDGFCGLYAYTTTASHKSYLRVEFNDYNFDFGLADIDNDLGIADRRGNYPIFAHTNYAYGYGAARKPYVKALTETQLTIGQSGAYSNGNNGTTVSYQVIEFFN